MNAADLVLSRTLLLTLDVDRLQADLHRLTTGWQEHFVDNLNYTRSWNVLSLFTAGGSEYDLVTPWEREFEPTPFLLSCAYFQEVLAQFQCPLLRVRLHRLEPGVVSKTHVDYLFDDHLDFARIHVPVITDPAVELYLGRRAIDARFWSRLVHRSCLSSPGLQPKRSIKGPSGFGLFR